MVVLMEGMEEKWVRMEDDGKGGLLCVSGDLLAVIVRLEV